MSKFSKMSNQELRETRNNLVSVLNGYSERVEANESLTEDEVKTWNASIKELEEVENAFASTPEGLVERTKNVTLNSNLSEVSNIIKNLSGGVHTKPAFEDDPRFGFKTDNEFLREVVNAYKQPDKADDRIKAVITNAVGSDEYSKGDWKATGILIPETMIDRILSLTPEADWITPKCTRVPMGASTVKIPARVDKDHTTSVTGGTRVYRTSEAATVSKSKDKYEMVALEATEIVGEAAATKILMRESPISIPSLIEASMKLASVDKRMEEALLGNGSGVPLGVLNAANLALLSVDRTATQLDEVILSGMDVIRMSKRCYNYSQAVWVANYDLWEIVQTLVIESPNNAGIVKLFSPVEGGVTGTLWGRPIYFTEYAPGITSNDGSTITDWESGFLSLHNFSEVLYGELYNEFNRSVHVRFSEREEVFQFVTANDMRPWWKDVLTPKKGITTRSPHVKITNTSVE